MLHGPDLAKAILDRVLDRGRHSELRGPSYRARHVELALHPELKPPSGRPTKIPEDPVSLFPEPTSEKGMHSDSTAPHRRHSNHLATVIVSPSPATRARKHGDWPLRGPARRRPLPRNRPGATSMNTAAGLAGIERGKEVAVQVPWACHSRRRSHSRYPEFAEVQSDRSRGRSFRVFHRHTSSTKGSASPLANSTWQRMAGSSRETSPFPTEARYP
jgi:hypothetical protein